MVESKKCILVVDDEETIRDLIKQLLELNDYETISASNGHEALEIYKKEGAKIDLVITDLGLPFMNGRELGENIRKLNPCAKMIIATGFAGRENYETLMQIGFLEIIRKPFDIREVIQSVKKALG